MDNFIAKYPEMPRLTAHELRHTFGSIIYERNDEKYITSKLMRHSSVDINTNAYIHGIVDKKREAIQRAFNQTEYRMEKIKYLQIKLNSLREFDLIDLDIYNEISEIAENAEQNIPIFTYLIPL
jgi:hypothetical protein